MNDKVERLRAHLRSELGETWTEDFGKQSTADIIRNYESLWRGLFVELASAAAAVARANPKKFQKMISFRGALDSSIVNASVEWNKGRNSYVVVMNGGLSRLIYLVTKLIATRVGIMGIDGQAPISPRNTLDSATKETRALMDAFFKNNIMAIDGYPVEALQAHQLKFIARFSHDVDRFVLAHELGHVILRESKWQHAAYQTMTDLCRQVTAESRASLVEEWAEELAADNIGLHLTLKMHENGMDQAAAFSCAELFFLIVRLLDGFFYKTHGSHPPLGTHPPGDIRLHVLRNAAQRNPPAIFEMGKGFEMIVGELAKAV